MVLQNIIFPNNSTTNKNKYIFTKNTD